MTNEDVKKCAAVYRSDARPDGNPLIEALPEQMVLQQLHDKLANYSVLPENVAQLSVARRMELVENLRDIYIPLNFSATIYSLFFRGLRSAYAGKTAVSITRQMANIGAAIEYEKYEMIPDAERQADCFSVLGFSGMGKTYTLNKILGLVPQVISHTEYCGKEFKQVQITYIRIQCPPNDSPKGACIQILNAIDGLLGTSLSLEEERKHSNTDMLISRIAQICTRFCIGAIVIDEIQNIVSMHTKKPVHESLFVRFLIELSNKTGVCLICVGTPEVGKYFDAVPHLARRTRGPRIMPLENNEVFAQVLDTFWSQIPLLMLPKLDEGIRDRIYAISEGVIETVAALLISCTQFAFAHGYEYIDEDMIALVAQMEGMYVNKKKAPSKKREAEILYEAPKPIQAAKKEVARITRSETVKRGRPKAKRDEEDVLAMYTECKNEGQSFVAKLVSSGIAEVVE